MVGIYCRISKHKEEGKDVSIAVQKKYGIEFAKSEGMEFRVFVDEGVSGATAVSYTHMTLPTIYSV